MSFIDIFVSWYWFKKCFIIKKIHKKAKETVTTVSHQDEAMWGFQPIGIKTRSYPALGAPGSGIRGFYSLTGRVDALTQP